MKKSLLLLSLMCAAVFAVAHDAPSTQPGPVVSPADSAPHVPTLVLTTEGVVVQPSAAESDASACDHC